MEHLQKQNAGGSTAKRYPVATRGYERATKLMFKNVNENASSSKEK